MIIFLNRDSQEVSSREMTNVYQTSGSTVQEMAIQMQHAKEQEKQDPLQGHESRSEADELSDDETPTTIGSTVATEVSNGMGW